MGEKAKKALGVQFDKRLRLEFHGARITSDAGLLACRELDGALGLTEAVPTYLRETRGGRNVQHELVPLLRQSVYSRLAGYEDTNDALRLARDPAMQAVVGRRALEKQTASTNTLSRFETEVLVTKENQKGLEQLMEIKNMPDSWEAVLSENGYLFQIRPLRLINTLERSNSAKAYPLFLLLLNIRPKYFLLRTKEILFLNVLKDGLVSLTSFDRSRLCLASLNLGSVIVPLASLRR